MNQYFLPFRASLICLVILTFGTHHVSAKCRADSVYTYEMIAGKREIATAEYYLYDEKDSLISSKLIAYQHQKPQPVSEKIYTYLKVKSGIALNIETRLWNSKHAAYQPFQQKEIVRNKKGKLLSETEFKFVNGTGYVPTAKKTYSYSKDGNLILIQTYWKSVSSEFWIEESKNELIYESGRLHQSTGFVWDNLKSDWKFKDRVDYAYATSGELEVKVMYHYDQLVWIPTVKESFGYDTSQAVKGKVVQRWEGAVKGWINQTYFVYKLNENQQTDTEVHLSWSGKAWDVNLTFYYVYNERQELIQILNDSKLVMVDRFCD